MKFGLEAKVGMFVISCLVLLGVMAIKIGGLNLGQSDSYEVISYVSDASGLTPESKVMFRGVEVGKIKEINLEEGKVKLVLEIKNIYKIPKNIRTSVQASGFLGAKHLVLEQTGDVAQGFLDDKGVVNDYYKSTDIGELSNKLGLIADDIKDITEALKEVLASEQGKNNMKGTLSNVNETTRVLKEMMVENQKRINNIVANIETLTSSLKDITVENQSNVNELISNLKEVSQVLKMQTPEIANKVNNITGNLDEVLTDSKTDLKETFSNVNVLTTKLEKTVDNINEITDKINKGEGTVGKLINDNETVDNINKTIKKLDKMLSAYDKLKLYIDFGGQWMGDTGNSKGYVRLKLQPKLGKYYLIGIDKSSKGKRKTTNTELERICVTGDCKSFYYTENKVEYKPDDISFTAQYAQRFFKKFDLKIGLFENNIGVGVDYFPFKDEKLFFSADAYDFKSKKEDDETHLKFKAQYQLFKNIYVNAGYDDPLNYETNSFFVGGGLIFQDDDLKMLLGKVPLSY
jgi:phospholipid/cholesterol/gamma-HCH transport system substrate-binding protein